MSDKDFELLVRYNSRDIEIRDNRHNALAVLKCTPNSWLSNYYSGTTAIGGTHYSIINNGKAIWLEANETKIGEVCISAGELFERSAVIDIRGDIFVLKRGTLEQLFVLSDNGGNQMMTIGGRVDKENQRNLLGLVYFDDKLYHSVSLAADINNTKTLLLLLAVIGYCIRLFLEIDTGEYSGKVSR